MKNFKYIIVFFIKVFKNNDDKIIVINQTIYKYQQRVELLNFVAVIIKFDIVLIIF